MSAAAETPIVFASSGSQLLGILHRAVQEGARTGVLVLVGGPQYRIGSHRQFVLMARALAAAGYPVLRFDYCGCGDSEGEFRGFAAVEQDVRAAIDAMYAALPQLRHVVIWGLCDAASAALMYCSTDARVAGVAIANPWVRTATGEARAYLRHYYGRRLLQASFWRTVVNGKFDAMRSLRDLWRSLRQARPTAPAGAATGGSVSASFIERMRAGLTRFTGPVLCLISERDLTAAEFQDLCAADRGWRRAMSRNTVSLVHLPGADHTFSAREALDHANRVSLQWLEQVRTESGGDARVSACR
jgi:uncharacterized protein